MNRFDAFGWRPLRRWAALAPLVLCCAVARQAWSTEPAVRLPLAEAARAEGALPRLLRAALQDFEQRLPSATTFDGTELRRDAAGQPVLAEFTWSENVRAFGRACAKDKPACQPLLAAQARTLGQALARQRDQQPTVASAVMLSALAELCGYAWGTATALPECPLNQRLYEAAAHWQLLGREALFVEYLERYNQQRSRHLGWLKSQGQAPSASTLAALPDPAPILNAFWGEATGEYADARMIWLHVLLNEFAAGRTQLRLPLFFLARLSWRMGDNEAGQLWEDALRETLAGQGAPACGLRSERWRLAIARARASGVALQQPQEELRSLLADDCPFSQATIEYAVDTLIAGPSPAQLSVLQGMLDAAVRGCNEGCAPARVQALLTLQRLARGQPLEMAETAEALQTQLRRTGGKLEADRQLAWAAAAALARQPALQAKGAALFAELQQHIVRRGDADRTDSASAQRDRSRYEPLLRQAALAAVQQGTTPELGALEAMRAQTLLRRLRLQSLAAELAGVHDAAAQAQHDEATGKLREFRKSWAGLPPAAGAESLLQALYRVLPLAMEEVESTLRLGLLQALAERKAGVTAGTIDHQRWMFDSVTQQGQEAGGLRSLEPQEAYLSWLEVPGGYIATVASYDPSAMSPPYLRPPGEHVTRSRFIALGPDEAATVRLYRDLLMAGAGGVRGARRSEAAATTGGLHANGLPVWRTAEGNFVAQRDAPAGATRAQDLREIGRRIYALLLQPLHAHWGNARRLVISPDGALSQLPFEALWAGERPLVDQVEISYVQSLAVHAELKRRAARPRAEVRGLMSVADPDYQAPPAATAAPAPAWMAAVQWNPLPGTRREAEALRPLFPGARLLAGRDASRARLLQMGGARELREFRVLHFATHGYVDGQRSALVLSTAAGVQDAYLQDGDISALELGTDLVVLSACDTGLGRSQAGEGVVGLPYAFMLAGNVNTVMSLWPVDDAGTAAFIPAFLAKARAGANLVEALNQTKREFAAGAHGIRNADPRIWAAFVQYGVPLQLK